MSTDVKPEVHLEISSGFFRIPTEHLVYNITVIGEPSGIRDVEKFVEHEKKHSESKTLDQDSLKRNDLYFQQVSHSIAGKIDSACRFSAQFLADIIETCSDEIIPSFERIRNLAESGNQKIQLASTLNDNRSGSVGDGQLSLSSDLGMKIHSIASGIDDVLTLLSSDQSGTQSEEEDYFASLIENQLTTEVPAIPSRYLFDLDVVFQTLYELCTNEPVKGHITTARKNASDYFSYESFVDIMNERISSLEPDGDNFFNVPMSDVLNALHDSCHEKPIRNLFKKMDSNQAAIFLDGVLPLEVPPREEPQTSMVMDALPEIDSDLLSVDQVPAKNNSSDAAIKDILHRLRSEVEEISTLVTQSDVSVPDVDAAGVMNPVIKDLGTLMAGILQEVQRGAQACMRVGRREICDAQLKWVTLALMLRRHIQLKGENSDLSFDQGQERIKAEVQGMVASVKEIEDVQRLLE